MFTNKEAAMIRNIAENDFADEPTDAVWCDCLDCGPCELDATSHGGIVASLCNKGLAGTNGETVCLTDAGVAAWEALTA